MARRARVRETNCRSKLCLPGQGLVSPLSSSRLTISQLDLPRTARTPRLLKPDCCHVYRPAPNESRAPPRLAAKTLGRFNHLSAGGARAATNTKIRSGSLTPRTLFPLRLFSSPCRTRRTRWPSLNFNEHHAQRWRWLPLRSVDVSHVLSLALTFDSLAHPSRSGGDQTTAKIVRVRVK